MGNCCDIHTNCYQYPQFFIENIENISVLSPLSANVCSRFKYPTTLQRKYVFVGKTLFIWAIVIVNSKLTLIGNRETFFNISKKIIVFRGSGKTFSLYYMHTDVCNGLQSRLSYKVLSMWKYFTFLYPGGIYPIRTPIKT